MTEDETHPNALTREEIERHFYEAKDAQRVLGLDKGMFYRRVNENKIPWYQHPWKKTRVYPKRDIDALARATHDEYGFIRDHIYFSRSTPGDQAEELRIGIACFGEEFITPLPERIAFQQKSEFTFWSLKVGSRVVGYVSMFRFTPGFLDDLLTGKRIEREIKLRHVLKFTRLEQFDVYIDVMAVDPTLPDHERRLYAGLIVQRMANKILDLRANNYDIRHLYTVTATPEGDRLVRKIGFHLMKGKSIAPGRLAYVFPLDEAGVERLANLTGRYLDV